MSRNANEFRQAREAKRISEPVEDDEADDDSLADGVDWRFTQPEDSEGGTPE